MFSAAFMNDEVDVFGKIASVLAKIIDTGILVTSIRRCIKEKVSNGEFIILAAWIPDVITSEKDMRKGVPSFMVIWWPHVHVREARSTAKGNMIAVRSDKTLQTTVVARSVMDHGNKCAELRRRMDSVPLHVVSTLVEEDNRRSTMSSDETSHSGQG
jgi:hypothetical protein